MEWPASNCLYNPDTPSWNTVARQGTGIFYLGLSISLIAWLISSLTIRLIPSSTVSFAINQNDMDQSSFAPASPCILNNREPLPYNQRTQDEFDRAREFFRIAAFVVRRAPGANTNCWLRHDKNGSSVKPPNQAICRTYVETTGHHPNLLKYLHLSFVYKGRWRGCCA